MKDNKELLEPKNLTSPNILREYVVIGTCSICGGDVVIPKIWFSVTPAVPKCVDCGAVAAQENVKQVIPMSPHRGDWNANKVVLTEKGEDK